MQCFNHLKYNMQSWIFGTLKMYFLLFEIVPAVLVKNMNENGYKIHFNFKILIFENNLKYKHFKYIFWIKLCSNSVSNKKNC